MSNDSEGIQNIIREVYEQNPDFSEETGSFIISLIVDADRLGITLSLEDYGYFGKVKELEILARPNETVH